MKQPLPDDLEISPALAEFIIALNEAGGKPLLNAVAALVDQVGPEQAQEHLKRYCALMEFEEAAQRDLEEVLAAAINNPAQLRLPLMGVSGMTPYPVDRPGVVCENCGQAGGQLVARARTDGMGEEIVHSGECPPPTCSMCGKPGADCHCVPSE